MTDALLAQLKLHEGWKTHPYMDSVGKITIGCGRNLSDVGLSDEEITYLLRHDLDAATQDLQSWAWFDDLDEIRQRVLIDMRFNLGPRRFRGFRAMLAALEAKDYPAAAKAMRNSLWFTQVKTRGERLVQMMRTGQEYQPPKAEL